MPSGSASGGQLGRRIITQTVPVCAADNDPNNPTSSDGYQSWIPPTTLTWLVTNYKALPNRLTDSA